MPKQIMDIDEFYVKSRKEFGRQQKIWFFCLVLFNMYAPLHMVQVVFTGLKPQFFTCTYQNTTFNNTCGGEKQNQCDSVIYYGPDTFIKKWSHSPCSSTVSQVVQMAYMLGVMIGALTLGHFSDRFGRKIVLLLTLIGMIVFGAAGSFVPYFMLYAVTRFFTGVCSAGNMISGFVLSSELVGAKYRSLTGNIFQAFFALGIVAYCGLAFLIQTNWQLLGLVSALIGVLLLIVCAYVPESPRWLFNNGKIKEGMAVLEKINGGRGSDMSDVEILTTGRRQAGTKLTMSQLFRVKPWLVSVQIISWFSNSILYYALTLGSQSLGGSLYISTSLSGLVELPAYIITSFAIEKCGRRYPLALSMIVAGIACIILEFTNKNLYIGLLGKCCIAASFSIIYIHSSELFPTVIRNSGVGLCSCFARIGGICASYFVGADQSNIWPIISLGILSILSGFLNLALPETLNRKLPETLEDLNRNEIDTTKYSRLIGEEEHRDFIIEEEEDEEEEDIEFSRN